MASQTIKRWPNQRSHAFPFNEPNTYVEFKKTEDYIGRIQTDVYDELQRRGCIENDELPPMDLNNPIHKIFRREAFTDITDDEYERLFPAVTLASRFITEDEYMGFWTHMCSGKSVNDKRPGERFRDKWRIQVIEKNATISDAEALSRTRQEMLAMADNLTFFIIDKEWSKSDYIRGAESFVNLGNRQCRRREDLGGKGCKRGECSHCDAFHNGRCSACDAKFYEQLTVPKLRELLKSKNIPHPHSRQFRKKADLVFALREHDRESGESQKTGMGYRTTNQQLSDLQVGLHWNVLKHIRVTLEDESWTSSEEIRFQLAVAATLCHELVHIFWWWTQRRCWNCEHQDPWWSKEENKFHSGPELGESWEHWAFGSRMGGAGKLHEYDDQEPPSVFERCQWSWTDSTEQGGHSTHPVLVHDFIFPVEYMNAWFQESTWNSIATHGRKAGRPGHDNIVIMRAQPQELVREEVWGPRECIIEQYSYNDLVASGGFKRGSDRFLYGAIGSIRKADGNQFISDAYDDLEMKRLQVQLVEAGERVRAAAKAVSRRERLEVSGMMRVTRKSKADAQKRMDGASKAMKKARSKIRKVKKRRVIRA